MYVVLAAAIAWAVPVSATSILVPDEMPSVQTAINAQPDTVLIRSGIYAEVPTLRNAVHLLGIPDPATSALPMLRGLAIVPPRGSYMPAFMITALRFSGVVYVRNDEEPCTAAFRSCAFDGGLRDSSQFLITSAVELNSCTIRAGAVIRVDGFCGLDSCTVEGGLDVGDRDARVVVTNSRFVGTGVFGAGVASGHMIQNTVVSSIGGAGFVFSAEDSAVVVDNIIEGCGDRGVDVVGNHVRIENNTVRRCGIGIAGGGGADVMITDNTITQSSSYGMLVFFNEMGVVSGNVIAGGGFHGMRLVGSGLIMVDAHNNTIARNGGSGIVLGFVFHRVLEYFNLVNNIIADNSGYGIEWLLPEASRIACNDLYANVLGPVSGGQVSDDDFSVDPEFCDEVGYDFHLHGGSTVLDRSGCGGLVGALGVGCDTLSTSVAVGSIVGKWSEAGIRLEWEIRDQELASAAWLERAESEGGPWVRPATERSYERGRIVEVDRNVLSDRAYWYRLVATSGGGGGVVIHAPVRIDPSEGRSFGIVRVVPNPSDGPVWVEFALARAASVGVEVFDVQGRKVASLAHGPMAAGRHTVSWPGDTSGRATPSSLYLVRYRYPGGQQVRRVLRAR